MTTATTEQPATPAASDGDADSRALAPQGKAAGLVTMDDGQFANLLDTTKFEHMWRVATLFSKSKMVPQHYQGKPEDCFIGVQMAVRLGVDPFMFLQNTYIVHGRPGMEAKLAIALVNSSGLFTDSLDYEVEGDDVSESEYRVRAFAIRKSTGKRVEGPWIDWKLVKAEGWDKTNGSKWKSMPALMFQYRAATFFARLHCPERLMGMQTADELQDVGEQKITVESTSKPSGSAGHAGLSERLASVDSAGAERADYDTVDAEVVSEGVDGDEPRSDEMPRWEQIIANASDRWDIKPAEARKVIDTFSKKLLGGEVATLDDKKLDALERHIADGDCKP